MKLLVILVEPLYQGNVGAVARSMTNFGLEELLLVNPCELGDVAFRRAKHGRSLLETAEHHPDFASAAARVDFLVATTGIRTSNPKDHTRVHQGPDDLCRLLAGQMERDIRVGLVFGRENFGLSNAELRLCDLVVSIPTNKTYPILNLSHAVTILCYELFKGLFSGQRQHPRAELAESLQVGKLPEEEEEVLRGREELFVGLFLEKFKTVLELAQIPEHKLETTCVAMRRVLGRSFITEWEYHRLMGFLSKVERKLRLAAKSEPKTREKE